MKSIIKKLPQIYINNHQPQNPIVFVHGFNSSYEVHKAFYQAWKFNDYYSLSLPGNNLLPAEPNQLNIEYYAQLISNFIQEKKLKNVILMGHSMGGGIISLVYELIPDLIHKLIYVAPMNKTSLVLKDVFFQDYFPNNFAEYCNFMRNLYYDPQFLNDPKWVAENEGKFSYALYHNPNIKQLGESLPHLELMLKIEQGLTKISVPTLLILGENDGIIMRDECAAYFKEKVKNITVKIVPKTGHMIYNENLDAYLEIIKSFLN